MQLSCDESKGGKGPFPVPKFEASLYCPAPGPETSCCIAAFEALQQQYAWPGQGILMQVGERITVPVLHAQATWSDPGTGFKQRHGSPMMGVSKLATCATCAGIQHGSAAMSGSLQAKHMGSPMRDHVARRLRPSCKQSRDPCFREQAQAALADSAWQLQQSSTGAWPHLSKLPAVTVQLTSSTISSAYTA